MSTRKSARRHRGRHKPYQSLPTSAATALAAKRVSERERLIPDSTARKAYEFWRDSGLEHPLFVYFIQADDGPVKIGKAHDPIGRLRELQCGNPRPLVIRALVLASIELEEYLHRTWGQFAHVRGEWFGCGYEQVILQLATESAVQQVEDFAAGQPLHEITDCARLVMSPYWLKEKAA